MNRIPVYAKKHSARLKYVLQFIFEECLNQSYSLVSDKAELNKGSHCINYSDERIPGYFQIIPSGLLEETGIKNHSLKLSLNEEIPVIFQSQGSDIEFDPFSAVFFMISRYEEYLISERDKYGRFQAKSSILSENHLFEIPVVNAWVKNLAEKLNVFYKVSDYKISDSWYIPTIDIDNPWAFKNRSLLSNSAGLAKDFLLLRLNNARLRIQVLNGKQKDPFDSFEAIDGIHDEQLKVFVLIGNKGRRDNKISPDHPEWRDRIKNLHEKYDIGIHPSYQSNKNISFVEAEKKKLEAILDDMISISRQHFLKLKLPGTYRNLISVDIQEDYSMGYAEVTGFRAGTSFPFYFYDILNEKATGLKVFPFAVMDRTLKDYLGLDTESAMAKIEQLIKTINEYGGNLISIWHNESLGDSGEWKGWAEVYHFLLKEGNKLNE